MSHSIVLAFPLPLATTLFCPDAFETGTPRGRVNRWELLSRPNTGSEAVYQADLRVVCRCDGLECGDSTDNNLQIMRKLQSGNVTITTNEDSRALTSSILSTTERQRVSQVSTQDTFTSHQSPGLLQAARQQMGLPPIRQDLGRGYTLFELGGVH